MGQGSGWHLHFCALRARVTLLCSSATAIPADVGPGCFSAEHLRLFLFVAAVVGREGKGMLPLEISDTNVFPPPEIIKAIDRP